jgi:hypothetical protein
MTGGIKVWGLWLELRSVPPTVQEADRIGLPEGLDK